MNVNGVTAPALNGNGQSIQFNGSNGTDSVSRNIQNQIADAQKQLMDLSANEEMTADEKMKKRQELQKKIAELSIQLSQHEIEQRKEKLQGKAADLNGMLGGKSKTAQIKDSNQNSGLSQASMQAIISADASLSQAKVQGKAASESKGRENILKIEIKLDSTRGGNTEAKEAQLAEVEKKTLQAEAAQMDTLAKADQEIKAAAKEDSMSKNSHKEKNRSVEVTEENDESASRSQGSTGYKPIDVSL